LAPSGGLDNIFRENREVVSGTFLSLAHEVTDAGLDALKDIKSLKSIYLIGTKVTPQAIDKLKQAIPGVAVYK